jgi:hypothetical protein
MAPSDFTDVAYENSVPAALAAGLYDASDLLAPRKARCESPHADGYLSSRRRRGATNPVGQINRIPADQFAKRNGIKFPLADRDGDAGAPA